MLLEVKAAIKFLEHVKVFGSKDLVRLSPPVRTDQTKVYALYKRPIGNLTPEA